MESKKTDRRIVITKNIVKDALQLPEADETGPDMRNTVCQWTVREPRYKVLFMDENLSYHILNKMYRMQEGHCLPRIMKDYGVTEWEADKIFRFMLYGNFAVNKSLKWEKGSDWYHIQKILRNLVKP